MRKLLQLVLLSHLVRLFKKHKPILQLLILKWEKPKRQHWKNSKNKRTTIYWLQGHIQFKKKIMESNFNLVHMEMKVVVAISSKPSEFFFKKIYTRNFYEFYFHIMWWKYRHQHQWTRSCIYFFVDPDTIEPKLTFFECLVLESRQDANGILDAIKEAFEKFNVSLLLNK